MQLGPCLAKFMNDFWHCIQEPILAVPGDHVQLQKSNWIQLKTKQAPQLFGIYIAFINTSIRPMLPESF